MSEALDRNKTEATHAATAAAVSWLDGLGCKPTETEVGVGGGWIADLASVWSPTMTEAKRSKLLGIVPPDVQANSHEKLAYLYRRHGGRLTIVIEVKTSRADYLRDNGRKYAIYPKRAQLPEPAHLCIIAGNDEVFGNDIAPDRWGRLILSRDLMSVRKFDGGWKLNAVFPGQIEDLIYGIAERRDHHTRYASIRRWMKSYRAAGSRRKSMYQHNGDSSP